MARTRRTRPIGKTLRKALLEEGPMAMELFEYELEEHVIDLIQSKRDDRDEYLFAVTEHSGDVAMVLIDKDDSVCVNEEARKRLQELWPSAAYRHNLKVFIPQMVEELEGGGFFVSGVKVAAKPVSAARLALRRWRRR